MQTAQSASSALLISGAQFITCQPMQQARRTALPGSGLGSHTATGSWTPVREHGSDAAPAAQLCLTDPGLPLKAQAIEHSLHAKLRVVLHLTAGWWTAEGEALLQVLNTTAYCYDSPSTMPDQATATAQAPAAMPVPGKTPHTHLQNQQLHVSSELRMLTYIMAAHSGDSSILLRDSKTPAVLDAVPPIPSSA